MTLTFSFLAAAVEHRRLVDEELQLLLAQLGSELVLLEARGQAHVGHRLIGGRRILPRLSVVRNEHGDNGQDDHQGDDHGPAAERGLQVGDGLQLNLRRWVVGGRRAVGLRGANARGNDADTKPGHGPTGIHLLGGISFAPTAAPLRVLPAHRDVYGMAGSLKSSQITNETSMSPQFGRRSLRPMLTQGVKTVGDHRRRNPGRDDREPDANAVIRASKSFATLL